jgi:hypothetical protein
MPIYKMQGKKDGLQKYRVRINYTDAQGTARQLDRVSYGYEEAKELERTLMRDVMHDPPSGRITVKELYEDYVAVKKYEVRDDLHSHKTEGLSQPSCYPDSRQSKALRAQCIRLAAMENRAREKESCDNYETKDIR